MGVDVGTGNGALELLQPQNLAVICRLQAAPSLLGAALEQLPSRRGNHLLPHVPFQIPVAAGGKKNALHEHLRRRGRERRQRRVLPENGCSAPNHRHHHHTQGRKSRGGLKGGGGEGRVRRRKQGDGPVEMSGDRRQRQPDEREHGPQAQLLAVFLRQIAVDRLARHQVERENQADAHCDARKRDSHLHHGRHLEPEHGDAQEARQQQQPRADEYCLHRLGRLDFDFRNQAGTPI